MFNIKLFEDFEWWYYEISTEELLKYLQNPVIYNFTEKDIQAIHEFIGPNSNNPDMSAYGFNRAELSVSDGKFILYDGCDLVIEFSQSDIKIVENDTSYNFSVYNYENDESIRKIPHFTLEISNFTKKYENIFINKSYDDWFIVEGTKNYKCDRIDGLLKFLERGNFNFKNK